MNIMFCCKWFLVYPFHFRNVFSTLAANNADLQSPLANLLSAKLNMSTADISQLLKKSPRFEKYQNLCNIEEFIHMLNRIGCSEAQIVKIIKVRPSLMLSSAEGILEPKIKFLEDFGIQRKALVELLSRCPEILAIRLENTLLPNMMLLKNIFQSPDLLFKVLLRARYLLSYKLDETLKPSLAFWERWGFKGTELVRLARIQPGILRCSSLTPAQGDLIHKIGADKGNGHFKYIISAVAVSRMETLEAKIENLKLSGLSDEEIWRVFRVAPAVLNLSKEKVRENINFLVNNLELPANYVADHTNFLLISLEKVMRPRFLVLEKIKSINDLGLSPLTIFRMSEAKFVKNIIKTHPDSTTLWKIYQSAISNAPNHPKTST